MAAARKPVRKSTTPRKRDESKLLAEIRLAVGARPDFMLMRINTGVFAAIDNPSRKIRSAPDGYPDAQGVQLRRVLEHQRTETNFSLYEKDDWYYFGQTIYIETKEPKNGRMREAQKNFRKACRAVGAIYIEARSVADVLGVLGEVPDWVER